MSDSLWSPLWMLFVVVLILVLAYWAAKWVGSYSGKTPGGRLRIGGGTEKFRVLSQISLGRDQRLLLVRLQERCYLLGVSSGEITLLKELDADEAGEWLAEPEKTAAVPPSFVDVLKENLWKKK